MRKNHIIRVIDIKNERDYTKGVTERMMSYDDNSSKITSLDAAVDVDERGIAIGKVMSGLLIGILLSRVVSGYIGEFGGWKLVYACAVVWMVLLLL